MILAFPTRISKITITPPSVVRDHKASNGLRTRGQSEKSRAALKKIQTTAEVPHTIAQHLSPLQLKILNRFAKKTAWGRLGYDRVSAHYLSRCYGVTERSVRRALSALCDGHPLFGIVFLEKRMPGRCRDMCEYRPVDLREFLRCVGHSPDHIRKCYSPDRVEWQKEYLPQLAKRGYTVPMLDSIEKGEVSHGWSGKISLRSFPRKRPGPIRARSRIYISYAARSYGPAYGIKQIRDLEQLSNGNRAGPDGPEAGLLSRKNTDQELKSVTTRSEAKTSRRKGRRRGRWSNGEESRAFAQEHGLDLKELGVDYDPTLGSLYVQFEGALFIALLQLRAERAKGTTIECPLAWLNHQVRKIMRIPLASEYYQHALLDALAYVADKAPEAVASNKQLWSLLEKHQDEIKYFRRMEFDKRGVEGVTDWRFTSDGFAFCVKGCWTRVDENDPAMKARVQWAVRDTSVQTHPIVIRSTSSPCSNQRS